MDSNGIEAHAGGISFAAFSILLVILAVIIATIIYKVLARHKKLP